MTDPKFAVATSVGRYYQIPGYENISFQSVTNVLNIVSKPAFAGAAAKRAGERAVKEQQAWQAIQENEGDDAAAKWIAAAFREQSSVKADLGTRVHHACENRNNELAQIAQADVLPYVEQYAAFLDEWKPEFIAQEVTVCNPKFAYAGTADMIVNIGGKTYIGDIKTGANTREGTPYPSAAMQMCAYANATHYVEGDATKPVPWDCDGAFVLDLKPRGYKVFFCDIGERVWASFEHCIRVNEWEHEISKTVFGEVYR